VLIHGLGLTRAIWDGLLPALSGYRVLAYDLTGHGQSAKVPVPALSALAGQALALMDHVGVERAALAGFSLGGMVNRRVALDRPDRVAALTILNSPHARDPADQARVEARALAARDGPAATVDEALARWFTDDFRAAHPKVVAATRRTVLANDPACYADGRQVLAFGVTELIRPDPPLTLPALVMTSEHDSGSTPAMARAIAAEIPGAACEIVPGLKHLGLVERPDLFADPLRRCLAAGSLTERPERAA